MESFYGGRPGAPFIIRATFLNIPEMEEYCQPGQHLYEIPYGDFVMVDSITWKQQHGVEVDIEDYRNKENGVLFRRDFEGMTEIAHIKGPVGLSVSQKYSKTYYAKSNNGVTPPGYSFTDDNRLINPPRPADGSVTDWQTTIPEFGLEDVGMYLWTFFHLMLDDRSTALDAFTVTKVDGIKSSEVRFAVSDSGTVTPATGWSTTIPGDIKGNQYLWTRVVITSSYGLVTTSYSVAKYARSLAQYKIEYCASKDPVNHPNEGWKPEVPSPIFGGEYLWTKITFTYNDKNASTDVSYTVSSFAKGIKEHKIEYAKVQDWCQPSAVTGWSTTFPSDIPGGWYLWTRVTYTYNDDTASQYMTYSVSRCAPAVDHSTTYYCLLLHGETPVEGETAWSTELPPRSQFKGGMALWTKQVLTMTDGTSTFFYNTAYVPVGFREFNDESETTSYITPRYVLTLENVKPGDASYTLDKMPLMVGNSYLWTRLVFYFNTYNKTSTTAENGTPPIINYIDLPPEYKAKSIIKTDYKYCVSDSGIVHPGDTDPIWSDDIPSEISGDQFLWRQTIYTYDDEYSGKIKRAATKEYSYSVTKYGKGVKEYDITYALSDGIDNVEGKTVPTMNGNQVALDTLTWTHDIPYAKAGKFLWVRTVYTMNDIEEEQFTTYSVSKNGIGIAKTEIWFGNSHDITQKPLVWKKTIDELYTEEYTDLNAERDNPYEFLWTKLVITYDDLSLPTDEVFTVSRNSTYMIKEPEVLYGVTVIEDPEHETGPVPKPAEFMEYTKLDRDLFEPGNYLWKQTTFFYSDGITYSTYELSLIAKAYRQTRLQEDTETLFLY